MPYHEVNSVQNKALPGAVLLIINADTSKQTSPPADRSRERLADHTALKNELKATVLDWNSLQPQRWTRLLAKAAGKGVAQAALAFSLRRRYRLFYCDSESNGLPLALLFKLGRVRLPLFMIGHWVTPTKKAVIFRWLKAHTHITTLFLHSTVQYNMAINQLGIPSEKVKVLPYQVDTQFWQVDHTTPPYSPDRPYICTAGLEFRDYATLIEAVKGLQVELNITVASQWSKRKNTVLQTELPSNVHIKSYSYQELRDLYAGSRFVVVPLLNVDFQAGITLILEAMAMGRAVIVTRSEGQGDIVVDRRKTIRNDPTLATLGNLNQFFGDELNNDIIGQTGFYVRPGNPGELRQAIEYLLANPERATAMGKQGRKLVEELMSVEAFAERIKLIIYSYLDLNP